MLLAITDKKIAKDAWEAIKIMSQGAEKVKKARVQTLKADFEALNMKDTDMLDEFYMKLNGIVSNKRALVEEVIGPLKAHEERLKATSEISSEQQTLTQEEWIKRERDDSKLLLTREEWLKKLNRGGTTVNTGMKNQAECRKPRRIKEQKQEINLTQMDDEPALLLAENEKAAANNVEIDERGVQPKLLKMNDDEIWESKVWYLDNGASNHMSGQRSKFSNLDETIVGKVKFGDGSTVENKGKGFVSLNCKNGEERILREVYFIPNLRSNIISLGQLSELGNKVIIHGEYLKVYDKNQRLPMNVKRSSNRLYRIIIESGNSVCLLSKLEDPSWLWHARLGHVNFPAIVMMHKQSMVTGMPRVQQPNEVCR
ncbi:uncharacterized protein LOC141702812 [Apium graveolens]|uniref:uncharacterized protein LOC141702812 n=1 Tax=Apium graveolens TaxID=4045 RepID=UPI003D79A495